MSIVCLAVAPARGAPPPVEDDLGRSVVVERTPQRIVSVLPSLTETVCALGRCDRLVGVDRYSNHPASVAKLPRVGGGVDPNLEAIVALRPDLVLMATSSRGIERLQSLGLTVLALEPRTLAQTRRVLLLLGQVLQVPDAERVWQGIEHELDRLVAALPPAARGQRVYIEVSRGGYAAAPESFVGELLARLGASNIVPGGQGPFPRLNPEFVVRADPDVIVVGDAGASELAARPGWSGLRAVRPPRLCRFDSRQADSLVRAGPRLAEGARVLADCLRGSAGAVPRTGSPQRTSGGVDGARQRPT